MSQTITEKILARAAGQNSVKPGENIWVNTDILLTHDICGPGTIEVFKREFGINAKVWDPEKVIIIPDHYIYTKDEKAQRNINSLRKFVKEQGLKYYYDPGTPTYKGVCHVALPQEGHVRPGEVIFGTDSHTCTHGALGAFATGIGNTDAGFVMGTGKLLIKVPPTLRFNLNGKLPAYVTGKDIILRIIGDIGVDGANYCAMEFRGTAIEQLNIEERMTICNMAIEAGGKNGIIEPDDKTLDYIRARTKKSFEVVKSDPNAKISKDFNYDVSSFVPCVAQPHLPSNYAPAKDKGNVKLDSAYIGSCTGGKITDFIMAAKIIKGHKVRINTYLVPATEKVAEGLATEMIDGKSLASIFEEAGCLEIAQPSCAACLGGPIDTFGRTSGKEIVISTTNRNFVGRMGSKDAPIYLASPLTVAASAIEGKITDPRKFM
ncbi:MAG: 3-isopropylmalate dehydratase large subunit [Kiritimatiellae bacterium]|nr:3-isopropylmalate dehydratase large subunit [Kiritimatiellia bacterium]MDD5520750.1 3-isopropylmalate dehydratase large subunit [Kiritimatiellia bacterium]